MDILGLQKASRALLLGLIGLQYELTSVVRVQSRGYWQCKFLLFYTNDMDPTMVKKLFLTLYIDGTEIHAQRCDREVLNFISCMT